MFDHFSRSLVDSGSKTTPPIWGPLFGDKRTTVPFGASSLLFTPARSRWRVPAESVVCRALRVAVNGRWLGT